MPFVNSVRDLGMAFNEDEIAEFRTEAFELLELAEKSLLALEQGGDFHTNYNSIFRVFHNLKGASGMLGLDSLGLHMHEMEHLLNSSKATGALSKEQIEIFLKGVDRARSLLSNPNAETEMHSAEAKDTQPPVALPLDGPILEFLSEANDITQRISSAIQTLEKDATHAETIDALYREVHTLKGCAFLFDLQELGDVNHAMESVLDLVRDQKLQLKAQHFDAFYKGLDLTEALLARLAESGTTDLREKVVDTIGIFNLMLRPVPNGAPTPVPDLQVLATVPATETLPSSTHEVKKMTAPTVKPTEAPALEIEKDSGSTIRVPVPLLDKLMTLMGEMVLVRNQVIQYSNRTDDLEFLNLSQRLNVITGEIQGEMMKTRMQPIGNVLTKFSRLVRELSKDLGKKIELSLSGAETELDKTLLEAVKDPLTHIVRNSCDHGIESPNDRKQAGKPESGTISVKSFHEGGQVIIEISDDGKGLHRDKLLAKAIEKGILSEDKASQLSDQDILHLIFAPGFSTAAKVTNVSGRGVGMDVVRTNIEKIGGSVEIQSVAGQGTTMRLKIPLTLAIVPAMIVRCGQSYFAIPQLKLVELVRVEQSSSDNHIEYIQGNPVYRLRGQILPLVHIRKVLNLAVEAGAKADVANIVVLRSDNHCFGLIVDEIQDTADIVVKPLARFLKSIAVFSGATVLGDGSIALILDVAGIVKDHIQTDGHQKATNTAEALGTQKRTVEDLQDFLLLRTSAVAKHALLLGYVHRLEEFKRSNIEISGDQKLVRYRNSVLPLISLDSALGIQPQVVTETTGDGDVVSVVVIEKGGSMYGLEVKEILDVMTTETELDTTLAQTNGVIGNLVTDNEIVVVVDPYKVLQNVMELESKSTKGDSVVIHAAAVNLAPQAESQKRSSATKILYVEDAIFFRRHVSKVLTGVGYEVVTANNGKEALDILAKASSSDFDLILSDIEMPQMNGFEFIEAIRQSKIWGHKPVIALSTRSDAKHIEKGLALGFNAYLEKMNGDELIHAIEDMTKRGAA